MYPDYQRTVQRTILILFLLMALGLSILALRIAADEPTGKLELYAVAAMDTEPAEVSVLKMLEELPEPEPDRLTLSFVGDCMLATMLGSDAYGTFNALANCEPQEYFFSGVSDIFKADDWTVANCENVFTDNVHLQASYKNYTPAYWYRSKAENANIFMAGAVEVVSIANNHSTDYGEQGKIDTIAALEAAGVQWGDNDNAVMLEKYGIKIALLCTTLYYSGYENVIIEWITSVREEADYVIIYYHGGTERQYTPDPWRVHASYKMIDAGADLILGNHPHVLQPMEVYNGGYIVHSLGNFLFGGSRYPENRTIIFQMIFEIKDNEILSETTNIIPCYVYTDPWKPAVITDEAEKAQVIAFMNGEADAPL